MLRCFIHLVEEGGRSGERLSFKIDFYKEYKKFDFFKLGDKLNFYIVQGNDRYGFYHYVTLRCKICQSKYDHLYFISCENKWSDVLYQELKINVKEFCKNAIGYYFDINIPKTNTIEEMNKIIYALNLYEAYHK